MERFLDGKTALVTGGTRGIGRAIAEHLLRAGAAVALCGRSQGSVERALAELSPLGRVTALPADMTSEQDVAGLFAHVDSTLGGLDILVNNAGVGIFRPVAELSVEEFRQVLDTNLTGAFLCCREALPRLRQRGGGAIINISSLAAKNPFAGGAAYNASKFGLDGFAEAMMLDHRQEGVRVTNILPGSVDTDFSPRSSRASWKIAPEDVAQIVLDVLRMPERTLISKVEVRPAKPPRPA